MLYVPFVLGILVAGRINGALWLLLLGTTALFISRESLLVWWRARARGREAHGAGKLLLIYLALAAAAGLPLIFVWRLIWLMPMGVVGIALLLINGQQSTQLEERSPGNEVLAICGLTLTAPAGYYVARGEWEAAAFWLWLLGAGYFASSVFYIKLRLYSINPRKVEAQQRARRSCSYYHSFLLVALAALLISGNLPLFALMGFAPVLARAFWRLLKPVRQVNLRRAGILEIVYSVVFLLGIALSYRVA
jgi:hypothetical protein